IAISSINPKGGAIPTFTGAMPVTDNFLDDNVAPLGNPGDNPFTGTTTDGIVVQPNNHEMFAALGSTGDLVNFPNNGLLSSRTLAFSFTINDDVGVMDVVGQIVQGSGATATFADIDATFGIAGDFSFDGDVDDS